MNILTDTYYSRQSTRAMYGIMCPSPTNWTEILCGLSRIIVVQSCAVRVQLQHLAMEFLDTMDKIAPVYGGQVEI